MNSIWRHLAKPRYSTVLRPKMIKSFTTTNHVNTVTNFAPLTNLYSPNVFLQSIRYKSKKAKYDSDDEGDLVASDDVSLSKDSKVVKFNTTSMRTDMILKSALGIARNKIEQQFYESRIRVNEKKILKKSASVRPGDEIDIVKMVSPKNSNHLYVSRVELISVTPKEENIVVTARRFKNLLIENYETDPYKGGSESEI